MSTANNVNTALVDTVGDIARMEEGRDGRLEDVVSYSKCEKLGLTSTWRL